jgi:hypothetical protein
MNINEARRIISNEAESPLDRLVFAVGWMALPENDRVVGLDDLLQCLRAGGRFTPINSAQEYAALALYRRTKRARESSRKLYEDLDCNPDSWASYLRNYNTRIGNQ